MISIGWESYKKYGRCVSLTNGIVKLLVTVDLGPRIIFYGIGENNIMCEDLEDNINKGGEFFEENLKGKGIWHLYGGHRFWKSPEYMDTYYPDNDRVEVTEISSRTIRVKAPTEITTKLNKTMEITMEDNGDVQVVHILTNESGTGTTPIAIWGLTVLDKGAKAIIPISTEDTGFLPNRNIVLWSYADLKDDRLNFTQDKIIMEQKDYVNPIKIGTFTKEKISVAIKGMTFTLEASVDDGTYPDYSCNIECYTNNHIFEIETLSSLKTLRPGEKMYHVEKWTLTK